jgi:hypothetical protein
MTQHVFHLAATGCIREQVYRFETAKTLFTAMKPSIRSIILIIRPIQGKVIDPRQTIQTVGGIADEITGFLAFPDRIRSKLKDSI